MNYDPYSENYSSEIVLVETADEIDPNLTKFVNVNSLEMTSEIILLPEPLAGTADESLLSGHWHDEQKLNLETFKEIVVNDVENVWVVAYVDPRCRDCLTLSVEWERLTQIEENTKRKVKLGYVDISV